MRLDWLGHYHSRTDSPAHRVPAGVKMGLAFVMILGTVLAPAEWVGWYLGLTAGIVFACLLSRLSLLFVLKRLLMLSPFVLGVALVNAFQPAAKADWRVVLAKSALCLATVIVLSNTTRFSEILRVLRRLAVPGLLITTLALMHRYLFVLAEEAERMRRARASRTFTKQRRVQWRALSSVIGQLFVRALERSERIYAAMCARGWR